MLSCNSNNEPGQCPCTEQKHERIVISTIGTSTTPSVVISSSEWKAVGNSYKTDDRNCNDVNYVRSGGTTNEHVITGTNTASVNEIEYRTSCR
ncbi:hypothetical protein MP478_04315 [Chryseobacterium sp. WG14]|uniref:hypothetical protein n=1 Tax=Chryseobacterium sp. WG14 TaxID=2926909 RepID=UPI00211DBCFF|nr:hypothetical protein [Chryseobacterium sp. WG14]MCQ9638604.1 hypothetical protein [Chryseobacterium sp. WG14]